MFLVGFWTVTIENNFDEVKMIYDNFFLLLKCHHLDLVKWDVEIQVYLRAKLYISATVPSNFTASLKVQSWWLDPVLWVRLSKIIWNAYQLWK